MLTFGIKPEGIRMNTIGNHNRSGNHTSLLHLQSARSNTVTVAFGSEVFAVTC